MYQERDIGIAIKNGWEGLWFNDKGVLKSISDTDTNYVRRNIKIAPRLLTALGIMIAPFYSASVVGDICDGEGDKNGIYPTVTPDTRPNLLYFWRGMYNDSETNTQYITTGTGNDRDPKCPFSISNGNEPDLLVTGSCEVRYPDSLQP